MDHDFESIGDNISWCNKCGCLKRDINNNMPTTYRIAYGEQTAWEDERPSCQSSPYEMHYTKDPLVVRRIAQSIMFSELMEGALDDHPVEQRAIGEHVGKLIEILDVLPEKMRKT